MLFPLFLEYYAIILIITRPEEEHINKIMRVRKHPKTASLKVRAHTHLDLTYKKKKMVQNRFACDNEIDYKQVV